VIAILMKDLIYLDEVFPDHLDNGEIFFYKHRRVSELILNTITYQMVPYPDVVNSTLDQYITLNMRAAAGISDKGLHALSKQWE